MEGFGLLDVGVDGIIVRADAFAEELLHIGAVTGRSLADLFDDHLPIASAGTSYTTVRRPGDLSGAPLMVRRRALDDGSMQLAVFDAAADVEQERAVHDRLFNAERTAERLELLLTSAVTFAEAASDAELAQLLAEAGRRAFRATTAGVFVRDETGTLMLLGGSNPLADAWPAQAPPQGTSTFRSGRIALVSSPDDAEEYLPGMGVPEAFRAAGIEGAIAGPLHDRGSTIGVLACYFDHYRPFNQQAEPLMRALVRQAGQTFTRLRLQDEASRQFLHDAVTGLPGRRLFEAEAELSLKRLRHGTTAIFIDLDGFKAVNDGLGHLAGDRLLAEVGRRLRATLRDDDVVARFGGDEFVAICDIAHTDDAADIAERVRAALAMPFPHIPPEFTVSASVGAVVTDASDPPPIEALIRAADHAMYQAKAQGGNRTVVVAG